MRALAPRKHILVSAALAIVLAAPALADTIATFADPTENGETPLFLFTLADDTLNGGWDGTHPGLELVLIMPFTGQVHNDATFTMDELTLSGEEDLSGGVLRFFDSDDALVLEIEFSGATMCAPFGFGAAEASGHDITMSGPGIPTDILFDESFAFSFANQVVGPDTISWTASFTSSALIPEPGTLALLGLLLPALLRRRPS
jgi:hypothetical protein